MSNPTFTSCGLAAWGAGLGPAGVGGFGAVAGVADLGAGLGAGSSLSEDDELPELELAPFLAAGLGPAGVADLGAGLGASLAAGSSLSEDEEEDVSSFYAFDSAGFGDADLGAGLAAGSSLSEEDELPELELAPFFAAGLGPAGVTGLVSAGLVPGALLDAPPACSFLARAGLAMAVGFFSSSELEESDESDDDELAPLLGFTGVGIAADAGFAGVGLVGAGLAGVGMAADAGLAGAGLEAAEGDFSSSVLELEDELVLSVHSGFLPDEGFVEVGLGLAGTVSAAFEILAATAG